MRWNERRGAGPDVRRATALAGFGAATALAAAVSAAVAQVPTARDTVRRDTIPRDPVRRDTVSRDTLRESARAGTRRPLPDSAARDSLVEAQLRESARARSSVLTRLGVDRLRLTELGLAAGVAFPDQVRSTPIYALRAEYGEILPGFRVAFGVSYWSSRYTDAAVAGFEDALSRAAGRPPGNPVRVGDVRSADIALSAEARWRPRLLGGRPGRQGGAVQPWFGLGGAAHFTNVQNDVLAGTFVERTLDGVAFGPTAALGVDVTLVRALRLMGEARYDLFNGVRYGSVRAGGRYVFERRRER